jgi:outer membrane protein OmpA-like peptidoglycan-associated protein
MNEFRGDTLNSVASAIGESPARTQSALGGVMPALIGSLINKTSTPDQAGNLLGMIRRNSLDSGAFTDIANAVKQPDGISALMSTGRPLVETLLGGRLGAITDWVTSLGGISKTSSSSLLSLALPLLLGQLGRHVNATGGGAASLMNLLGEQRSFLRDAAPSGLMSLLGGAESTLAAAPAAAAAFATRTAAETQRRTSPWLWALPALLLIPLLLYFMGRGRHDAESVVQSAADIPRAVATAGTALGEFVDKALPDNIALHVPANGFESKLLAFIEDPRQTANGQTWFTFDRLEFDTDSATLTPAASEQLGNVAAIMKAYPNVKMKIGGYTDNTADSAHNLELSQARANAAMQQIVQHGVDASRLSAQGYGDQNPVADNSTPEGRQRNRRVDISVTEK